MVYSGPRLAEAVFSWGREIQEQVVVMAAGEDTGSAQGGGSGPRQREQRAASNGMVFLSFSDRYPHSLVFAWKN